MPSRAEAELIQVLDAEGRTREKIDGEIPDELLLRMHRIMVLNRAFDARGMNLQRQGRIHFYAPSTGEEAAAVGSALALKASDWIAPTYRSAGVLLTRGMAPKAMADQLYANRADVTKGRQMPVHWASREQRSISISSPIATQIPQAVGVAYAMKLKRDKSAVIAYFGDGGTSEGDFHVAMNFAGVWKVPCVFFCTNNQWAISVPLGKQTASETIAVKAKAYGFEGVRVDGNDILAVHRTTKAALEKARSGGGPTLIEALTYRMGPHSTSDDPRRYREDAEMKKWGERDPIVRFGRYLEGRKLLSREQAEKVEEEERERVRAAMDAAEKEGPPALETLVEDVFAKVPPHLEEQLKAHVEHRKGHPRGSNGSGH